MSNLHLGRIAAVTAPPARAGSHRCSGGDPDDDADEAAWRPSSDVPTEPGSDGLTPPGAVLPVGQTARVRYEDDFAELPDDHQDQGTPYYVRATVTPWCSAIQHPWRSLGTKPRSTTTSR